MIWSGRDVCLPAQCLTLCYKRIQTLSEARNRYDVDMVKR